MATKKNSKKTATKKEKTKRKYTNGDGPRCSLCGTVGHYKRTCGRTNS